VGVQSQRIADIVSRIVPLSPAVSSRAEVGGPTQTNPDPKDTKKLTETPVFPTPLPQRQQPLRYLPPCGGTIPNGARSRIVNCAASLPKQPTHPTETSGSGRFVRGEFPIASSSSYPRRADQKIDGSFVKDGFASRDTNFRSTSCPRLWLGNQTGSSGGLKGARTTLF
jgi:hypothetical protein